MPRNRDDLHDSFSDDESSGWMSNLLAEENEFDRRTLWRLGSWAVGSVGALVVAILATHSSANLRRDQLAYADLAKQSQQVQWIAKESQSEARRLTAAVETLNGDRDRLYSRVTILEQGLDSVTGSVSRQATSTPGPVAWPTVSMPPVLTLTSVETGDLSGAIPASGSEKKAELKSAPQTAPSIAPVTTVAASDASSAGKPSEPKIEPKAEQPTAKLQPLPAQVASLSSDVPSGPVTEETVQPTEFGVDIGSANSVEGLRALWRGAIKSQSAVLGTLQPLIVVKERNDGLGMRLHLVAGPIADAASAAKICASLIAGKRDCATALFDGQRLALESEKPPAKAAHHKRKRRAKEVVEAPAPAPQSRGLSAILGFR